MRNKRSELNELIQSSRIQPSIESLEILLDRYQSSAMAEKNRYLIKEELEKLRRALSMVEAQLTNLKTLSLKWENVE